MLRWIHEKLRIQTPIMEVLENQQGRPLIDVGGDGKVVESVGKIDCRNDYYQGQQSTNPGAPSSTFAWDAELDVTATPSNWVGGRFSF